MILRRNPNFDLDALRRQFPDVNVDKLRNEDKIRGHYVPKVGVWAGEDCSYLVIKTTKYRQHFLFVVKLNLGALEGGDFGLKLLLGHPGRVHAIGG